MRNFPQNLTNLYYKFVELKGKFLALIWYHQQKNEAINNGDFDLLVLCENMVALKL